MSQSPSPDDSFDPSDRMPAVRARVPEHVAAGQISTGVIVVTGATEYILDFVRNLPRPNMIVARVVLPHSVMPQFTDALTTNINLYRQRFGDLGIGPVAAPSPMVPSLNPTVQMVSAAGSSSDAIGASAKPAGPPVSGGSVSSHSIPETPKIQNEPGSPLESERPAAGQPPPPVASSVSRHASPQEVYDELKLRDELLSGTYANAVMIGHGPHEFCFDFITNFYPQSAVSCRVFMAAGHVGRLLESLRASWEQLRPRLGGGNP
jgi:Protein of unknown function (DUF3467)